jgi:hypothetical protein
MYIWLSDVVEDQGYQMIKRLNKIYMFGIIDADDNEIPLTLDFQSGKGDFYIGDPKNVKKEEIPDKIACNIRMSEKVFHDLLD